MMRRRGWAYLLLWVALGLACSPTSPLAPPPRPTQGDVQPDAANSAAAAAAASSAPLVEDSASTVVVSPPTTASPEASAAGLEVSTVATPAACAPAPTPAGYEDCQAVEVTGAAPCEAICRRPRRLRAANRCCEYPVEVVVMSGSRRLLRVEACGFVPPDCAHVHGHGNMDAALRILDGPPPELIVVEGGCEMRATMHGYVPPGVAAWTGCRHQRYRYDGRRLVQVAKP